MKKTFALLLALSLLSCFAYASTPPEIIPPVIEVSAPTDPPPSTEDGTAPTDPLPPTEDGTAPTDPPPPTEDGITPADPPPPTEDGITPTDPIPPNWDGLPPEYLVQYPDPETVALLTSALGRIDFFLFVLIPIAIAVLVSWLFCRWFEKAFIDSVDSIDIL